jgi:L-2,4-diaminobutyrate decarboxylase
MNKVIKRLKAPVTAIRELVEKLKNEADVEIANKPDTGILCFRFVPESFPEENLDKLQEDIYERIMSGGERTISITKLDEKTFLRLVALSPSVTSKALKETISEARKQIRGY